MLITNGLLLTMDPRCPVIQSGALRVEQGRIVDIGSTDQIAGEQRGQTVIDADGKLVMPGLICAHTHFYGAFARGMAVPGEPPADFVQVLRQLWWRLDKALDSESVAFSALVCLVDAIKHGTTTLIDHHASPNFIDGSLDVIAQAVKQAGLRASLCYEVTDRDGKDRAWAGMRENERFAQAAARSADDHISALFGLHASMTLSEETLQSCAGLAVDLGIGCHIHVAEGGADVRDSLDRYGCRVVERLHKAGILGKKALAAHCVHINEQEKEILSQTNTNVVHNPRSNMNNAVGVADVPGMLERGVVLGLGNDGFSNNMFVEMNVAYLLHKLDRQDPRVMPADQVLQIAFANNAQIAACCGLPHELGLLRVGAPADIIIVDYDATTPLTAGNVPWHILFGVDGTGVETTIVGGQVIMQNRQLLTLDETEIMQRSRFVAQEMWRKI